MLLLLLTACLVSLPQLKLSNDFSVYFGDNNPQLAAYQKFEQRFVAQDNIAVLLDIPQPLTSTYLHLLLQLLLQRRARIFRLLCVGSSGLAVGWQLIVRYGRGLGPRGRDGGLHRSLSGPASLYLTVWHTYYVVCEAVFFLKISRIKELPLFYSGGAPYLPRNCQPRT